MTSLGVDNPIPVKDTENGASTSQDTHGISSGITPASDSTSSGVEISPKTDLDATEKSTRDSPLGLNVNKYATVKSAAQGLLDLALLAANASQLKTVLQAGEDYEFYTLIMALIIASIVLQALQAIICVILGAILDLNKVEEQRRADIINNIVLATTVVTVVINVVISTFDIKEPTGST